MTQKKEQSGELIAEGKTKIIRAAKPGKVLVLSKDDITAGDGAKIGRAHV